MLGYGQTRFYAEHNRSNLKNMENVYLVTVSSITCFVYYLGKRNNANKSNLEKPTEENVQDQRSTEIERNVKSLQLVYLPAHLLALFSDWLQVGS